MSLSFQPLTPIVVGDPLLQHDIKAVPVIQGPSIATLQSFTTNSISSNSLSWSVVPPQGVVTDRRFRIQIPVRLTFTGTAVASNAGYVPSTALLNSGYDAPRQYPLMHMINTIACQLNNDTVNSTIGDSFPQMVQYNTSESIQDREDSTTAACGEESANYADLIGQARNPLGNYGSSATKIKRGAYPFKVVSNAAVTPATGAGTACAAVVDMVLTENVMLSPMFWGAISQDSAGFFGLNNINLALNFFGSTGGKYWCHAASAAITTSGADTVKTNISNIAISFSNFSGPAFSFPEAQPTLQLKFLTPNLLQKPQLSLSDTITYNFWDQNQQTTDIAAIPYAATGVTTVTMNAVTLSQIPSSVYLFVKPRTQNLQALSHYTDATLPIYNVNIQFGNQSSILSQASQVQLFDICVKNGLHQASWPSWSGQPLYGSSFTGTQFCGIGSVLKLNFGEDIYLPSGLAAGQANGNYQFSCTMQVANRNNSTDWDALPLSIYAVFISPGSFTISNGNASHQVAVISGTDVMNASEAPSLSYRNFRTDPNVLGGDFMSSLGDFGNSVNDFLKKSKLISTVGKTLGAVGVPLASQIGAVGDIFGYGMNGNGYAIGGKMMNKSKMQKSLMYR